MKLLILFTLSIIPLSSQAQGPQMRNIQRTLKDTTTMVALDLNEKTVFCTERGYGINTLKVSVPDLVHLAHFDHKVAGEAQPCIQAGACTENNIPSNIIIPDEPYTIIPIRVRLIQNIQLNVDEKTCAIYLSEKITTFIRNRSFIHFMQGAPGPMDYEKCLKLAPL